VKRDPQEWLDPRDGPGDVADPELLAWLLDERTRGRRSRDELLRAPGVEARLAGLETFLERCRDELLQELPASPERLEALEREILVRTTREDVSWRGDLRLVRGFLRQRLSASIVLRVVAASLLVHLAALPVLAYFTWVAPWPETRLVVELPKFPRELPYLEAEREPEPHPAAPGAERDLDSLRGTLSAAELFHERLVARGVIDMDGFSEGPAPDMRVWDDELGLVLRCEQLLDEADLARGAGRGGRPEHLAFALSHLRLELQQLAGGGEQPALRVLAASAWLRAQAGGALEADARLDALCARWLRASGVGAVPFLSGDDWLRAERRAEREVAGR
jgi:hypothetical protein